jgi:hypothetical protein
MSAETMREVVVEAILTDAYDGAIRLLGDAQRFGFGLLSLALVTKDDGTASVTLSFLVPTSVEAQLVATRLARHPAVWRVEAASAHADNTDLDGLQAVAA